MYMGPITTFFETGIRNIIKNTKNAGHNCTYGIDHTGNKLHASSKGLFALWLRGRNTVMYMGM